MKKLSKKQIKLLQKLSRGAGLYQRYDNSCILLDDLTVIQSKKIFQKSKYITGDQFYFTEDELKIFINNNLINIKPINREERDKIDFDMFEPVDETDQNSWINNLLYGSRKKLTEDQIKNSYWRKYVISKNGNDYLKSLNIKHKKNIHRDRQLSKDRNVKGQKTKHNWD